MVPGEEGGRAVAEILFGDVNPSARLPVTFYKSTEDLRAFDSYSISNRTYRYFSGKALYPFGYGLSYTRFKYRNVEIAQHDVPSDGAIRLSMQVANTGTRDGDEVVEVYFRHVKSAVPQARESLCGFRRVTVARGETATIVLDVPASQLRYWDTKTHQYTVESGKYELLVGASSDDIRARVPFQIR